MNLTNLLRETKGKKHEMINTILFGMIGLAAVSFIIYMIYIYTITLEKRILYTAPIQQNWYKKQTYPALKEFTCIISTEYDFCFFLRNLIVNSDV